LLASLTCRLIVAPASAWHELIAVPDEALPRPALHVAAVAGLIALATAILTAAHSGSDFGGVLRSTLAAIGGGVGAGALAVTFVPSLLTSEETEKKRLARYASLTALPLSTVGLVSLLPRSVPIPLAIAALSGIAYRSGSIGAHTFLGLTGPRMVRAARVTTLVSALPPLLAALLCASR
jgi:hypothetical protein